MNLGATILGRSGGSRFLAVVDFVSMRLPTNFTPQRGLLGGLIVGYFGDLGVRHGHVGQIEGHPRVD